MRKLSEINPDELVMTDDDSEVMLRDDMIQFLEEYRADYDNIEGNHDALTELCIYIAEPKEQKTNYYEVKEMVENIVEQMDGYEDQAYDVADEIGVKAFSEFAKTINDALLKHKSYHLGEQLENDIYEKEETMAKCKTTKKKSKKGGC